MSVRAAFQNQFRSGYTIIRVRTFEDTIFILTPCYIIVPAFVINSLSPNTQPFYEICVETIRLVQFRMRNVEISIMNCVSKMCPKAVRSRQGPWSGNMVCKSRFEPGTFRIKSRNANHDITTFRGFPSVL